MLEKARVLVSEHIGNILELSPVYRSEPWGFDSDDWFLNQVVRCETACSAEDVLTKILDIEKSLGRIRSALFDSAQGAVVERNRNDQQNYQDRTIDIDILYFNNDIIKTENLEIPHKHLQERRFALMPLNDIAPNFVHPVLKKTTSQLLDVCEDEHIVELFLDLSKRPKYPYITIEGVIGVGKTTLAEMLAETFNAKLVLESFAENPFLPKFYEDKEKYAFPVELSFMAERFHQLQEHLPAPDLFHDMVISDYITEKSLIFAGNTLPEDVFTLYSKLFHIIFAQLPKPDLLVYLYASPEKLKQNIVKRGRDYEQNIELDYLSDLQDSYLEHFKTVETQRVLIIDVNNLDFVSNPKDYYKILELLQENYPLGVSIRNLQINDDI